VIAKTFKIGYIKICDYDCVKEWDTQKPAIVRALKWETRRGKMSFCRGKMSFFTEMYSVSTRSVIRCRGFL